MWGFIYRSTVGGLRDLWRGRIDITQLLRMWRAVAELPLVYVGWAKDFWEPFEWYLRVERGLPATYFLIPFKKRTGDHVTAVHASRRATAYDVRDIAEWTSILKGAGCELGLHGIDAWHSVPLGRAELAQLRQFAGDTVAGVRMHWLLHDQSTPATLDHAGFAYDSTAGYNETVGYRNGTVQVFRPLGASTLLELPLHIQDGALFYTKQLDLSEPEAEQRCRALIENARSFGGVLTVLWHDRSHGPERFWGGFYERLVAELKQQGARFVTANDMVQWFRARRAVRFETVDRTRRIRVSHVVGSDVPTFKVRLHDGGTVHEVGWNGRQTALVDELFAPTMCEPTMRDAALGVLPQ
jgi:peptidoglycan/xylan/chitin deacetylase (PgdA/CDA1 family)